MARHAQSVHQAEAHWEGGLTDGKGQITGSSSGQLANTPLTWNARVRSGRVAEHAGRAPGGRACGMLCDGAVRNELQGRKMPPRNLDRYGVSGLLIPEGWRRLRGELL